MSGNCIYFICDFSGIDDSGGGRLLVDSGVTGGWWGEDGGFSTGQR